MKAAAKPQRMTSLPAAWCLRVIGVRGHELGQEGEEEQAELGIQQIEPYPRADQLIVAAGRAIGIHPQDAAL